MKLLDYTTEAALLPRQVCPDLGQAVKRLAHAMARAGLVSDAAMLARDVLRREGQGGTALPAGLAITHARSEAAARVCLSVATLTRPVTARGADGEECEVDVVVLLAGPSGDNRALLRILARLVRAFRGGDLGESLRSAGTRRALAEILATIDTG
jgi:fructose-specific PTS system IIC-like component